MGSVASYNGKPALIKKTGTLFVDKGQHYFEMQINVHNFGAMTRLALGSLKGRFKEMAARVAFTIEGRSEDQLPELVLGCADLHNLDIVECSRWAERGALGGLVGSEGLPPTDTHTSQPSGLGEEVPGGAAPIGNRSSPAADGSKEHAAPLHRPVASGG